MSQTLADRRHRDLPAAAVWPAVEAVLAHRPTSEMIYVFACVYFYKLAGAPEYCDPISRAGVEAAPQSILIPITQGHVWFKYLQDPKRAAEYYRICAARPGCPDYYGPLADKVDAGADVESEARKTQELMDRVERQLEER